jgi:hypothetical protein
MADRDPGTDDPTQPKPRSDAYTGMLMISLIALLVGCALLWLDLRRYPSGEPPRVPASPSAAPAAK